MTFAWTSAAAALSGRMEKNAFSEVWPELGETPVSEWRELSLFVDYRPESFCREFVELRGHSALLYNYMAVALEVKPLLDDWIPVGVFEDFERVCRTKYGLHVKAGAVWTAEASDEYLKSISPGETLSTTKFFGARYDKNIKGGNLHVFVSKSKDNLEKGFQSGWYPLIINHKVAQKPYIDFIRFGYALGYPACCVDYFLKENPGGDFLAKIYGPKNVRYDFRCNCLAKDTSFSYIYHMPCGASCAETIKYTNALREEIKKRDPLYVEVIDRHLKAPYLYFGEQDIYAFDGTASGGHIAYKKSYFVGKPRYNLYNDLFREADRIECGDAVILVFKENRLLKSIKKEKPERGRIVTFE